MQHVSCDAFPAPGSPAPHVVMPAVSAVAHERGPQRFVPGLHAEPDAQSPSTVHLPRSLHRGGVQLNEPAVTPGPPQSTSLSPPFCTPSVALGSTHTRFVHARSAQSSFVLHPLVTAHFGAFAPPQSTSVSPLFFLPSVGPGASQTPCGSHVETQSALVLDFCPLPHG